ncbi:unnamed protein product [Aphis gossypii]|uniref:Uncharacterized protein n=1 Tax=Aphis gossypii TaxID=80765 RepID=A0A9P0IYJ8_APHGO|nr:unnamed protein product [Aphis gossypii]CAH1722573.1 unnamed protein product [Aphis gossypii]
MCILATRDLAFPPASPYERPSAIILGSLRPLRGIRGSFFGTSFSTSEPSSSTSSGLFLFAGYRPTLRYNLARRRSTLVFCNSHVRVSNIFCYLLILCIFIICVLLINRFSYTRNFSGTFISRSRPSFRQRFFLDLRAANRRVSCWLIVRQQ